MFKKVLFKLLGILFLLLAFISAIIFVKLGMATCLAATEFNISMVLTDILGLFITTVCTTIFGMFGFIIFNES